MQHRKNVLTWCISMYHVIGLKQTCSIQNITLKAAKKLVAVHVYWEEKFLISLLSKKFDTSFQTSNGVKLTARKPNRANRKQIEEITDVIMPTSLVQYMKLNINVG